MINKKLYQIIIDAEMTEDVMLKTVGKNIKNVRVKKRYYSRIWQPYAI